MQLPGENGGVKQEGPKMVSAFTFSMFIFHFQYCGGVKQEGPKAISACTFIMFIVFCFIFNIVGVK